MITRFLEKVNLKRVMYEYSNGIAKAREYLTSNHLD
jgi:hypothetical protein